MTVDANPAFGADEPPSHSMLNHQSSGELSQHQSHHRSSHAVNTYSANPYSNNSGSRNVPLSQIDSSLAASSSVSALSHAQLRSPTDLLNNEIQRERSTGVDAIWHRCQKYMKQSLADQVTPVRLAGHLSVLLVAAVILIMSQVELPGWDISLRSFPTVAPEGIGGATQTTSSRVSQILAGQNATNAIAGTSLQRAIVPFTIIPEEPQEGIESYTVQAGDTVLGIAEKFGLKPESIQWANPSLELNPDLLYVGDQLDILPVDGALHRVKVGETLSTIASQYKVSVEDIVGFGANNLVDADAPLSVGKNLIVPDGVKSYVPQPVFAYTGSVPTSATKGTGSFVWTTSGSITQRFWSGHKAIDIGSWPGAPVKAADSGHVIEAHYGTYNNGYGNAVVIDHGNGFVSLYAHLNSIYVRVGENVRRGQQIGTVGNTGNSTGPHLHLEIRYQGVPRNPLSYLR